MNVKIILKHSSGRETFFWDFYDFFPKKIHLYFATVAWHLYAKNGRRVLSRSDVNSFKGQLGDPYTHKGWRSILVVSSEIDEFGSTARSLVSENIFLDIRSGKNQPAQYSRYSRIMLRVALVVQISRILDVWI